MSTDGMKENSNISHILIYEGFGYSDSILKTIQKVNSMRMTFSLGGSFIAYIKYETQLDFEVEIWMNLSYLSNVANDLYILYFLFDHPADKTSEIS